MNESGDTQKRRYTKMQLIVGALIPAGTIAFLYFIVLGLHDMERFMTFTADQHPIERPIYLTLCALGAWLIYWGVVWLYVRLRKPRETNQD